jgi:hypothetical protein
LFDEVIDESHLPHDGSRVGNGVLAVGAVERRIVRSSSR